MRLNSDSKLREYFQEIQQVFLYITDSCSLGCRQCLYKPWLRRGKEIRLEVAIALLKEFRKMGAVKLSILGGEPTEYRLLPSLINSAKNLGYEYVRLDTNGQFESELLAQRGFRNLDELTFSIDGDTPGINDPLRGAGTFYRCLSNIKEAVEWGYNVDITCCVHRGNIGKTENGDYLIERMIEFISSIGVQRINFHPLFRMGVARDRWAGKTDIPIREWADLYLELRKNIEGGKYKISVRIPQRFVTLEEFKVNPTYYGYCPVKMGERVLVHANGQIQICALMIGTPYSTARFKEEKGEIRIMWETGANELEHGNFDITKPTPCTNQHRDFGNLVLLCISFKPKQEEFVWKKLRQAWALKFKGET